MKIFDEKCVSMIKVIYFKLFETCFMVTKFVYGYFSDKHCKLHCLMSMICGVQDVFGQRFNDKVKDASFYVQTFLINV